MTFRGQFETLNFKGNFLINFPDSKIQKCLKKKETFFCFLLLKISPVKKFTYFLLKKACLIPKSRGIMYDKWISI